MSLEPKSNVAKKATGHCTRCGGQSQAEVCLTCTLVADHQAGRMPQVRKLEPPPPLRRFGLFSLMVLMTAVAIFCGTWVLSPCLAMVLLLILGPATLEWRIAAEQKLQGGTGFSAEEVSLRQRWLFTMVMILLTVLCLFWLVGTICSTVVRI